jgi:HD-GYP domain-containing protein (c-di-GMP phosphodiesterase class II)
MTATTSVAGSLRGNTAEFERFVVFLVISFGLFHLVVTFVLGKPELLPASVTVSTALALVLYLWVTRTRQLSAVTAMRKQIEDAQVATISALVETIEAKDPYIGGHSKRVSRIAEELALHMGLREDKVRMVARAGLLHDIGKLGIRDDILHKSTPLSQEDWAILKDHPRRTYEILAGLDFLYDANRLALLHHERYDGKGYGTGLCGNEIPLEASILAIADAFDAMNSKRPYRMRMSKDAVLSELNNGRGTQHAGAVVEALIDLLYAKPELWSRA